MDAITLVTAVSRSIVSLWYANGESTRAVVTVFHKIIAKLTLDYCSEGKFTVFAWLVAKLDGKRGISTWAKVGAGNRGYF